MTTKSGFPEGVTRVNPACDQQPGPPCPFCKKPMIKRIFERSVGLPSDKNIKTITEFKCPKCKLHFKSLGGEANFNPIPTCDFCKEPLKGMIEERRETTDDSYVLKEGRFVYDGGDVDGDNTEYMHDECNEYPGDEVLDWYLEKKDESSDGENH